MTAASFEAVVFDIGGVLEHTPPTNWQDRWCDRLGLDRASLHDRLRHLWLAGSIGEITLEDVHRGISDSLSLSNDHVVEFMNDLWDEYLGTPNTKLIDYFASLRTRFRTGILSNSFVGAREREREQYGFEAICDVVVYSHEEGIKKPEPDVYRLVCGRLDADPQRTLFVDDHDEALVGALAVGLTPVKFVGQQETIDHIEALLAGQSEPWSPDD